MSAPTVVVFGPGYDDYRSELDVLAPLGVEHIDSVAVGDDALGRLASADAILVREAPLPAPWIERLDTCRIIVRYGVGVDNIDLDAAREREIYVANVPDYGTHEVAEHALALMFAVGRRIVERDREVRNGRWGIAAQEPLRRFAGATLGLVGFGRIAEALWHKAEGLGFAETLVHDPARASLPNGVRHVDLGALLQGSDVVSLHAPATPATRHLIGSRELALMRPHAILVNTARGALVDEDALADALEDGRLRGAGLDVFEREPLPSDSRLRSTPNTVLTDHTAWYSEASLRELQRDAALEVARVLRGSEPENWVNRWPS